MASRIQSIIVEIGSDIAKLSKAHWFTRKDRICL